MSNGYTGYTGQLGQGGYYSRPAPNNLSGNALGNRSVVTPSISFHIRNIYGGVHFHGNPQFNYSPAPNNPMQNPGTSQPLVRSEGTMFPSPSSNWSFPAQTNEEKKKTLQSKSPRPFPDINEGVPRPSRVPAIGGRPSLNEELLAELQSNAMFQYQRNMAMEH